MITAPLENPYVASSNETFVAAEAPVPTAEHRRGASLISHIRDPLDGFNDYANPNWDGFGADPIADETVASARRFHQFAATFARGSEPNIAPGSDGTVGFEWRSQGSAIRKLFVEIRPDGTLRAYWVRQSGAIERQPIRPLNFAMYMLQP